MDTPVAIEVLAFECWRFDRRVGRLFRQHADGGWLPTEIGSRALSVLDVLLDRRGILVSQAAIMDAVWPHCVAPNNLTVQIAALRRVLDAGRTGGSCIQTVPGQGYRFVVTATKLQADDAADKPHSLNASPPRSVIPSKAPRLSVVVLPFVNLGGGLDEAKLAAVITADLTTDLCCLDGASVVAYRPVLADLARPTDAALTGKMFGVRYAVAGSLHEANGVSRINVQLICAETNRYIWAGRFDHRPRDINRREAETVSRMGAELVARMLAAESTRSVRERPNNPDAFDLLLRARARVLQDDRTDSLRDTSELLRQALYLNPMSVPAMGDLVRQLLNRFLNFGDDQSDEDLVAQATTLLAKAAAIEPQSEAVTFAQGYLFRAQGRWTEAIAVLERVVERFPHSDNGFRQLGFCKLAAGEATAAIPLMQRAFELNPLSVNNRYAYRRLAQAHLVLGRDAEAIEWAQRALVNGTMDHPGERGHNYYLLASAYALIGQLDAARHALAEAKRLRPFDTVRTMTAAISERGLPTSVFVAQIERIRQGLRAAEMREHAEEAVNSGLPSDGILRCEMRGLTPGNVSGARTLRTTELLDLLSRQTPVLIDVALHSIGRSLPDAIGLQGLGHGAAFSARIQSRFRRKIYELTRGDPSTPIVAYCANSERFTGYNLALRLVGLGYTQVYWYRGGWEAWHVAGLSDTPLELQSW